MSQSHEIDPTDTVTHCDSESAQHAKAPDVPPEAAEVTQSIAAVHSVEDVSSDTIEQLETTHPEVKHSTNHSPELIESDTIEPNIDLSTHQSTDVHTTSVPPVVWNKEQFDSTVDQQPRLEQPKQHLPWESLPREPFQRERLPRQRRRHRGGVLQDVECPCVSWICTECTCAGCCLGFTEICLGKDPDDVSLLECLCQLMTSCDN